MAKETINPSSPVPTRVGLLGVSAIVAVAVAVSASLGVLYQAMLDGPASGDWSNVRMVAQAIVQRADRLQRRQAERPAYDGQRPVVRGPRLAVESATPDPNFSRHVGLDALCLGQIDLPPPAGA